MFDFAGTRQIDLGINFMAITEHEMLDLTGIRERQRILTFNRRRRNSWFAVGFDPSRTSGV